MSQEDAATQSSATATGGDETTWYHIGQANLQRRRERAENGRVVIRRSEIPWQENPQAILGYYIYDTIEDTAIQDWRVFTQDLRTQSGRHTHQGGIALYVTKGRGYTIVEGERYDWKEGDLILLPVVPGGVEHQHFNENPDGPSQWVAFIHMPFFYATGSIFRQVATRPEWRG